MQKEKKYSSNVGSEYLKKLGQFFTPYDIAEFMCKWVIKKDGNVLDPAVGNAVFFRTISRLSPNKRDFLGYEIDRCVIDYFDSHSAGELIEGDYLTSSWDDKYDCIICNPPYNKFQSIDNRGNIYACFEKNGYGGLSRYTNQYILFLIKSLSQLKDGGRLAYIIPSEFLNSKYGSTVKQLLVDNKYLRTIINFQNDKDVFFNALTTCCIIFVEKTTNNTGVEFINIEDCHSINSLDVESNRISQKSLILDFEQLKKQEKWLNFLKNEEIKEYNNTVDCKTFFKASRGIATGNNDYFLFSYGKARTHKIPRENLKPCVCRAADVKRPFFTEQDFEEIVRIGKNAFILNVENNADSDTQLYLNLGEEQGVNKKYLPAHRKIWHKPETSKIAPIWLVSAGRGEIKVVRNLAGVPNLTTFHGIIVKDEYKHLTDVIFLYLISTIGQAIIKQNKKELGGGLDKFQPNDINDAKMLDVRLLMESDLKKLNSIYAEMLKSGIKTDSIAKELNMIFERFL